MISPDATETPDPTRNIADKALFLAAGSFSGGRDTARPFGLMFLIFPNGRVAPRPSAGYPRNCGRILVSSAGCSS